MMTQRAIKLWEECRSWPEEERAELADHLLESLDSDFDVQAAWDKEIATRVQELEQGTVQCVPSEEVHRTIREMIDASRLSSPRTK